MAVDALAGIPASVAALAALRDQGLAISIVSLGEVFDGAFGTADPEAALVYFRNFLSDYPALPLTDPIMTIFARTRDDLRSRECGFPI